MKSNKLKVVLEKHQKWLDKKKGGVRANLVYADLSNADLWGANLRGADLSGANLVYANLSGANLSGAYLSGADLSGADLSCANLWRADLHGANLRGANLRGANLSGADLSGAKTEGVKYNNNTSFYALQCPEVGSFTAFKKCRGKVVELFIPESAKRSSATCRKCRADKAKVMAIYNLDKTISDLKAIPSDYDESFIYEIGKTVSVKDFDEDRWNECSTGIHFFMSKQEAVDY